MANEMFSKYMAKDNTDSRRIVVSDSQAHEKQKWNYRQCIEKDGRQWMEISFHAGHELKNVT